jgi:hypothetical protein
VRHFRHDLAGARGRCQLHGLHGPAADARYAGERTAPSWRTAFKPTSWKCKAPAPALPPGRTRNWSHAWRRHLPELRRRHGRRPCWPRRQAPLLGPQGGRPRPGGLTDEKSPSSWTRTSRAQSTQRGLTFLDCATLALPLTALPPLLLQQLPHAAENPPEQIAE